MAKEQKPDFICTTNDKPSSLVDVPCKRACKITYRFAFQSALSLPYAVAINGGVLSAFKDRPKRTDGKISVMVQEGQTVQLYLNSDAHPAFRRYPVYTLKVSEHDIDLLITEINGKHADTDVPVYGKLSKDEASGRSVQHMSAKLTGDIWMKVSHRYTPDEVDARMPEGTSVDVRRAIRQIYEGLSSATLTIEQSNRKTESTRPLMVTFTDSNNPRSNITNYSLLRDGLTRVHPGGYAALFNAALEAGIQTVTVSSCWRPMLGSIAHRAGLGLDVSVLGGTVLNRQELRRALHATKTGADGNGNERDNVTDAEVKVFKEYEQSIVERKRAEAELVAANKALAETKYSDGENLRLARERQRKASDMLREQMRKESDKGKEWGQERDLGEPSHVRQYRVSLLKCACVRQLFDPWFIDANVKDDLEPEPNKQVTANEALHSHHLHITVDDPKIL